MSGRATWLRISLTLGLSLAGCVVNPVPTPISTSQPDKGGAGQTDQTPATGSDAGRTGQTASDTVSGGFGASDVAAGPDAVAADASAWDGDLAQDATGLGADATETGDID